MQCSDSVSFEANRALAGDIERCIASTAQHSVDNEATCFGALKASFLIASTARVDSLRPVVDGATTLSTMSGSPLSLVVTLRDAFDQRNACAQNTTLHNVAVRVTEAALDVGVSTDAPCTTDAHDLCVVSRGSDQCTGKVVLRGPLNVTCQLRVFVARTAVATQHVRLRPCDVGYTPTKVDG